MALKLGSIGERIDIDLRAGSTLGPFDVALADETGAAINLTGCTFDGAVSKRDAGATSDVALTVAIVSAPAGTLRFSLASASTGAFDGASSDFFSARADYAWALFWTDSAGTRQPLFYGAVNVAAEALP